MKESDPVTPVAYAPTSRKHGSYLCSVLVHYNLGLMRVEMLHIRMIPAMVKFLCTG